VILVHYSSYEQPSPCDYENPLLLLIRHRAKLKTDDDDDELTLSVAAIKLVVMNFAACAHCK